jgi:hypothetical protein
MNLCIPKMCLTILLSFYANLRNVGALVLSYEFLFTTASTLCHYVCLLVPSLAYDCILVHLITPFLNYILLYHGSSLSLNTHTRLVLTSVVMTRWITLSLCRLMWKHGLSCTTSRKVDFLHFCGTP